MYSTEDQTFNYKNVKVASSKPLYARTYELRFSKNQGISFLIFLQLIFCIN